MEGLKGESDKAKEKSGKVEGEALRKIPECSAEIRHQTLTAVWHFKVPEHFTPHAGGRASMWPHEASRQGSVIFVLQETEAKKFRDSFKLSQQAGWHNRPLNSQFIALSRAP